MEQHSLQDLWNLWSLWNWEDESSNEEAMIEYKYLEYYPMWRPSHRAEMRRIMKLSNIP